jgi:hypothetical protein
MFILSRIKSINRFGLTFTRLFKNRHGILFKAGRLYFLIFRSLLLFKGIDRQILFAHGFSFLSYTGTLFLKILTIFGNIHYIVVIHEKKIDLFRSQKLHGKYIAEVVVICFSVQNAKPQTFLSVMFVFILCLNTQDCGF